MGNYSYVNISNGVEDFDEQLFWDQFDGREVKVSIKFCRPGLDEPTESDYITLVIYESYQFTLSA